MTMAGLWTGRRRTTSVDDYPGVLVSLDEAHLHSHTHGLRRRPGYDGHSSEDDIALEEGAGDGDAAKVAGEDEATAMLDMSAPEYSIEGLRREVRSGAKGERWTAYEMKSKLINKAIQDIGMGRYNWQLFVLCGFGWFADNLWMQGVSLTLPSLSAEFGVSEKAVRYTTSWLFVGLCLGSFFWGLGSDIMGRRIAFNATLLITGVFGMASAFASTWGGVCVLFAAMGFGVGGNLPVDGALFLEFLPDASSSLLTLLSVWWPIGQLVSSLLAWLFIANWPADKGWRLFVLTMGIVTLVMFTIRFFLFQLFESPKFLLSRGRQAEAVAVVHGIAFRNNRKTWLTSEILDAVVDGAHHHHPMHHHPTPYHLTTTTTTTTTTTILRQKLSAFSSARLRPLFHTRPLATATLLIWFIWTTIGLGYPLFNAFLPQYLSHSTTPPPSTPPTLPPPSTYRSYAITSLLGLPGSLLAFHTVDSASPLLGRRGTLALSTLVSAVFLFLFVRLGTTPAALLGFSCVEAFAQNIMYGVLYAFTPELFPAPVRGAGVGVASFLNRAAGLAAPLVAAGVPGEDGTSAPVYLAGALMLAAFVGVCAVPIETRGRQRL